MATSTEQNGKFTPCSFGTFKVQKFQFEVSGNPIYEGLNAYVSAIEAHRIRKGSSEYG